jgi:hypothetical protein
MSLFVEGQISENRFFQAGRKSEGILQGLKRARNGASKALGLGGGLFYSDSKKS